jgi:hypothetical protein
MLPLLQVAERASAHFAEAWFPSGPENGKLLSPFLICFQYGRWGWRGIMTGWQSDKELSAASNGASDVPGKR